ncbi:hypothetical protein YC2023_099438 [Brassica napus]
MFLGIFRGTCSSEFSDENSEEHFVGTSKDWTIGKSIEISRGSSPSVYSEELSDEQVVLGISSEICFLGIPSENSEGFPRKNEFPRSYFRGLVSSVCRRNNVIPTTYRRFFLSVCRCFLVVIVPTELEYEKLIKVCFLCKRLTHDQLYCDMQEDLAVDYWESRARSRQNIRLEARSSVSRQGKDDNELRNAAKGGHRGTITSKSELVPRRSTNLSNRRGLERKGNNVVGETSQIWKPKSSQSVPLKGVGRSRSTEESPHPGNKSTSQGMMGAGASSGVSQESPSVFSRLGDQKDISPQERQLSGSQRKEDRPSSLVFERLGGHNSSSSIERQIEDTKSSGNKRRRLSRSDERIPKKARLGREREETPSSVFERLGSSGKGSGSRGSGEKHHSAYMAANAPNCSAQRIVLGAAKLLKKG